jgi:hypothetical protein
MRNSAVTGRGRPVPPAARISDRDRVGAPDQRPRLGIETDERIDPTRRLGRMTHIATLNVFGAIAEALAGAQGLEPWTR